MGKDTERNRKPARGWKVITSLSQTQLTLPASVPGCYACSFHQGYERQSSLTILIAVEGVSPKIDLSFLVNGGTRQPLALPRTARFPAGGRGVCLAVLLPLPKMAEPVMVQCTPSVVPMSTQTSQTLPGLQVSFIFSSV